MDNDTVSIVLISRGKEPSRYIHINLKLVKSLLFTFVAIISFLGASFAYDDLDLYVPANTVAHSTNNENSQDSGISAITPEVVEEYLEPGNAGEVLEEGVPLEYRLAERMLQVEEKLKDLQSMLQKKGIRKELSIGGEFIDAENLKDDYFEKIEADIDNFSHIIQEYPIGMPSDGSVSSYFGHRQDPFNKRKAFHSGIDFDSGYGDGVISTARGSVEKAGWCGGYGKCVVIKHKYGYKTLYGHLSRVNVKPGQRIEPGQKIGEIGSTGRSTGPHLHYEIMKNGKKINPYKYLSLG